MTRFALTRFAFPRSGLIGLAILSALAVPGFAQQSDPHAGHHGAPAAAKASPASQNAPSTQNSSSTKAFEAANAKMHHGMAIAFSGDADIDFIRGMIPHHQGAIDMAKVVLAHGKDTQTRKLAQDIIAAQEKEIAMMQDWLKKRGQ